MGRCRYNKELSCDILNEILGDCEICDYDKVVWRCPDYIVNEETKKE